jgi:uncharacterized protein
MVVLDRADCLRRLGDSGVGRVAVTVAALPAIFPINYAVLNGDIMFRTSPGTKLAAAMHNSVVAFEVDDLDRHSRGGWSVVVVGRSREVTDPADIAAAKRLPLTRWGRLGGAESVVRLRADLVSGRELAGNAEDL